MSAKLNTENKCLNFDDFMRDHHIWSSLKVKKNIR